MEYKKIDLKSYNIHLISINRFKTSKIEVIFRNNVNKEKLVYYSFLANMMNESNKKYKTRRDVAIKMEEIYKPYYYAYNNKLGNCQNTVFSLEFINPEYIDEKNYLDNIIKFLFEMILKPNVENCEFDLDTFNIVKNNMLLDIDSIEESAERKAINSALKEGFKDSVSSLSILGSKEEVLKITPEDLYNVYLDLINNSSVDIFVIGKTNMDNVVKAIKKHYHNHQMHTGKIEYYIDNPLSKKEKYKEDTSKFLQSQLVMIYNLKDLTKDEKEITFHILNYILGNGGITSKLYRYIREENSLCYSVSSMYFKYDNLLCIASSLAKDNIKKAHSLVKKAIKEMKEGLFTDEDVNDAKKNLLLSLNINKNNPSAILANYEFNYFIGSYLMSEKIKKIEDITKKDIICLAKKIYENTVYVLCEDQNEGN